MRFTTRQATEEEVVAFGQQFIEVNWGVWIDDEMVALFQAEEEPDGWLNVHARVARRRVSPAISKLYAYAFATRLLELGAPGLKADIKADNRAAIWMAKAAGFTETGAIEDRIILTRLPNGNENGQDAIREQADISGMETD